MTPVRNMAQVRNLFWEKSESLKSVSDTYWEQYVSDSDDLTSISFFTEDRICKYSEYFYYLEDAYKLGIFMGFEPDNLRELENELFYNIEEMVQKLFANYIILTHEGDRKCLRKLTSILFSIGKSMCATIMEQDFEDWNVRNCSGNVYSSLDNWEQNWKGKLNEKARNAVFGWEDKTTPDRFFDYLGNLNFFLEINRNNRYLSDQNLKTIKHELLTSAPHVFAFQYFRSSHKIRYSDHLIWDNISLVTDIKKAARLKNICKMAECRNTKLEFESIIRDNVYAEYYKKCIQENEPSSFMIKFQFFVNLADNSDFNKIMKKLLPYKIQHREMSAN